MLEKKIYKKRKKLKRQISTHNEFMDLFSYLKKNINILNPIIIDVETTGIKKDDEILQISIVDLMGNVLFNKYIKPRYKDTWEKAYNIHNISFLDVKDKKEISYYRREIEKILKKHKMIIGYEIFNDMNFFKRAMIDYENNIIFDLSYLSMLLFKNLGLKDKFIKPSLIEVANKYNYSFNAHNALDDALATLFILKRFLIENMENFKFEYDKSILKEEVKENKKSKLEKLASKYISLYEKHANKIILDIESTGIRETDEILQLSIIDLDKNILFNKLFKPIKVKEWDAAYKIHKISKEQVENELSIENYRKLIQEILDKTEYMIGYGIDFDYMMLKRQGFNIDHIIKIDISEYFKYLYRQIIKLPNAKRPKLIECSNYYGFKNDNFHNSLVDCMATLVSYKGIYKDMLDFMKNK